VASGLALEAEVVVTAAEPIASEPIASLLMSDQLPELLGSASRTSTQWSSGVAVANAVAKLPLPGVLLLWLGTPRIFAPNLRHL
jgi:hypothetical protein